MPMEPAQLRSLITFIRRFKDHNPAAAQEDLRKAIEEQFAVVKERSICKLEDGALRLSEANVRSFSNVVLSLSALRPVRTYNVAGLRWKVLRRAFRLCQQPPPGRVPGLSPRESLGGSAQSGANICAWLRCIVVSASPGEAPMKRLRTLSEEKPFECFVTCDEDIVVYPSDVESKPQHGDALVITPLVVQFVKVVS